MKCVRSVCANKTARRLNMGGLGTAVLGCTHTPINGSIYCRTCHDASAVYGVAGDVQVGVMDVATQAEPTVEEDPTTEAAAQAESARNKDVYLVADVLDAERQTVTAGGAAHRKCARAGKKRFLISWVGYPSSVDSWVCECNVGKAAVQLWKASAWPSG